MIEDEGYPVPQPVFGHSTEGSLQYQIEVKEIIEDLKHALKCEVEQYNAETGEVKWVVPEGVTPAINDKGINSILIKLKGRLTKIFILSDFEEEQIEEITEDIGRNIIDDFELNWEEYEIRDPSAASDIMNLVTETVYATLRKGKKGNYLKFLSTTTNNQEIRHRTLMEREEPSQKSSINPLNLIFGKRR